MNKGRDGYAQSGGFTLMELLVAMTLLGILMTALFGSLRLGARVWEASDRVLKHEGEAMAIRSFLNDRFEQAMPVVLLRDDGRSDIIFAGERSVLRFASTMPESVGFGPYIIELVLTPGREQQEAADLSIRWRLAAHSGVPEADDVKQRILVNDVAALALGYFGAKEGENEAPAWHGAWHGQERLPDLIRLDLGFDEEDGRRWAPLIVSPRVDEWYDTDY